MGFWLFSAGFAIDLGEHPSAKQLADLDLRDRAFARVFAKGEITTFPPKPLDTGGDTGHA